MSDEEQKQLFRRFTQGSKHTYQHYGGKYFTSYFLQYRSNLFF